MTSELTSPQSGAASVAQPQPPAAKRIPVERTHHGDTVIDEYSWLADKDNPDTIAYLEAENAYTEAMTQGQGELRAAIFDEIKGRTQETDLSVPSRKGQWWYYARTVEGEQYPVYCRCPADTADPAPPAGDGAGPRDGEQVTLECNDLARDAAFFALGT